MLRLPAIFTATGRVLGASESNFTLKNTDRTQKQQGLGLEEGCRGMSILYTYYRKYKGIPSLIVQSIPDPLYWGIRYSCLGFGMALSFE